MWLFLNESYFHRSHKKINWIISQSHHTHQEGPCCLIVLCIILHSDWTSLLIGPQSILSSFLCHYLWFSLVSNFFCETFPSDFFSSPVRMAAIQKSTNNKCWRGCGQKGILLQCSGEHVLAPASSSNSLSELRALLCRGTWLSAGKVFMDPQKCLKNKILCCSNKGKDTVKSEINI